MTDAKLSAIDLGGLEKNHQTLLSLCLALEEIASALPEAVDREACRRAAVTIPSLLRQTHLLEETMLFPDFDRNAGSTFSLTMIEQLKAEHRCDLLTSAEVSKTLMILADGRDDPAASSARYLLNGFLESIRRHVLSEKLIIEALLVAKAEGREILA